jgi:hypothetical protein
MLTLILKKSGSADVDITARVLASSTPNLTRELDVTAFTFTVGDVTLTLQNEDGYFTTLFGAADPEAIYPNQYYLQISKNGTVVWEGDLDASSTLVFDSKLKTCTATFLHALKRLDNYKASDAVRPGLLYKHRNGIVQSETHSSTAFTLTDADLPMATNEFQNHAVYAYCSYKVFDEVHDTYSQKDAWFWLRVLSNDNAGTLNLAQASWNVTAPVAESNTTAPFHVIPGYPFYICPIALDVQTSTLNNQGTMFMGRSAVDAGLFKDDSFTMLGADGTVRNFRPKLLVPAYPALYNETQVIADTAIGSASDALSLILTNPYNKNMSIADVAALLFTTANISSANYVIDVVEYSKTLDYLDFTDKHVGEALAELAANANAVLFWVGGTYYFIDRSHVISGSTVKALDSLLMTDQVSLLWPQYTTQVKITGGPGVGTSGGDNLTYLMGRPSRIVPPLEISTDFIGRMSTLMEACTRLYNYFATKRKQRLVQVLDDGTAYQIWDRVSIGGVEYIVTKVDEPLRSVDTTVLDNIQLTLIERVGTAPSAGIGAGSNSIVDYDPPSTPIPFRIAVEANGANYDYALYCYYWPETDLWKCALVNMQSINGDGSATGSSIQAPFTRKAPAAPTTGQVAGGTLAAATYYVKITCCNVYGETIASAVSTQAVAANNYLKVTAPAFPVGITSVRVYAGTDPALLYYQGQITSSAGTWTQSGALVTNTWLAPAYTMQRVVGATRASATESWYVAASVTTYTGAVSPYCDALNT